MQQLKESSLLIVSHTNDDFRQLVAILQNYFPFDTKQGQDRLMIKNKYYQAIVRMNNIKWDETDLSKYSPIGNEQQSQQQDKKQTITQQIDSKQTQTQTNQKQFINPDTKHDLMIMLVNQQHHDLVDFGSLDLLIQKYNPDEFVLLINSKNPQQPWKYEQLIAQKCNNFIEIVKDNLPLVAKERPTWSRGALLNDEEENLQSGIFSVLDRIETTRWTHLVNLKDIQHSNPKVNPQKQQQSQKQPHPHTECQKTTTTQQHQNNLITHQKLNIQENSSEGEQQIDETKLQSQMLKFEQMMSQMMSFKIQSTTMKDTERKQKAEELFTKMFAGIMDQQ